MTEGKPTLALKLVLAAAIVWLQAFSLAHAIEHDHHAPNLNHHNQVSHHHHHFSDDCDEDEHKHDSERIECECLLFAAQNIALLPNHDVENLLERRGELRRDKLFSFANWSWPPERGPPPRGPPN